MRERRRVQNPWTTESKLCIYIIYVYIIETQWKQVFRRTDKMMEEEQKKRATFHKFTYPVVELDQWLDKA